MIPTHRPGTLSGCLPGLALNGRGDLTFLIGNSVVGAFCCSCRLRNRLLVHILLSSYHAIVPPRPQELQGLDYALAELIPLQCDELFGAGKDSLAFATGRAAGQGYRAPTSPPR